MADRFFGLFFSVNASYVLLWMQMVASQIVSLCKTDKSCKASVTAEIPTKKIPG